MTEHDYQHFDQSLKNFAKRGDDQALFVEEVEVEHALLSARVDQAGAILAGGEPEAGAAFHAAEDADQPFADRPLSEDLVDELVLAVGALEVDGTRRRRRWAICLACSTRVSDCSSAKAMKSHRRILRT